MNVLVVEDDLALGRFLERRLRLEGHTVVLATDASSALEYVGRQSPDLAILDLAILDLGPSDRGLSDQPGGQSGAQLFAALTEKPGATSILVLTENGEPEERVRCLDMGADDVLQKPISFRELAARCRALKRRREQFADPIVRHGEIRMDRMARRVVQGEREVDLSATEFRLLEALLKRRGQCASRPELLREVWQMEPEGAGAQRTNIVEVYINYLRKKLNVGVLGRVHSSIRTVRGEGYRLDAAGGDEAGEQAALAGAGHYAVA